MKYLESSNVRNLIPPRDNENKECLNSYTEDNLY